MRSTKTVFNWKLSSYRLPFISPLSFHSARLKEKEGLILTFERNGFKGRGDISPLFQFNSETLVDAETQLRAFLSNGAFSGIRPSGYLDTAALFPSVAFGVESALLTLEAAEQGTLLRFLLNSRAASFVPVNGLITSGHTVSDIQAQITRQLQDGISVFKLKVGRASAAEDAKYVNEVSALLPQDCRLRLDANRAWTADEAFLFNSLVRKEKIDYIEEPLQNTHLLDTLPDDFPPLALDESIRENPRHEALNLKTVSTVVLKPSLTGGIHSLTERVQEYHHLGKTCVISSSFESPLGLNVLTELAAALTPGIAAGLDTARYFDPETLQQQFGTF